jgi:hypothetical protein
LTQFLENLIKKVMQKQYIILLFNILIFNIAIGQNKAALDKVEAINHLKAIKNGAVIVIKLPTGTKVLASIDKDAIAHQGKKKYNERLVKRREVEIKKNQTYHRDLLNGLSLYYKYSPFIAVYDTAYSSLLDNPSITGIFYDKSLNLVKDYSLVGKDFYTFRLDQVYPKDNQNRATVAFVLTDKKGQILKYPFPSFIPTKFKRVPILPNNLPNYFYFSTNGAAVPITTKQDQYFTGEPPKARIISRKQLDKNYYYAIAKFLQMRFELFEAYIGK